MCELCYMLFCRCRPAPPRFYELLFWIKSQVCMNKESLHIHAQFEQEPKMCNIWALVYLLCQHCLQSSVENLHKTFQSGYFLLFVLVAAHARAGAELVQSHPLGCVCILVYIPSAKVSLVLLLDNPWCLRARKPPLLQRTPEKSTVFSWHFGG